MACGLYGSRSHKTKRLLNELTTEGKSAETDVAEDTPESSTIIKKSMIESIPCENTRNLLISMEDTYLRAAMLLLKCSENRT